VNVDRREFDSLNTVNSLFEQMGCFGSRWSSMNVSEEDVVWHHAMHSIDTNEFLRERVWDSMILRLRHADKATENRTSSVTKGILELLTQ
jgi:hypothetical protein